MKLEAQTVPVEALAGAQRERMHSLMRAHYEGVDRDRFEADLREKQWVILLSDGGTIRGFSTQRFFSFPAGERAVNVLFSGDTIVEKEHWGSLALPLAWGRLMLSLLDRFPETGLYWLLTTKGYKTYRFLPVFFHEFYPCCSAPTPALEQSLLDRLAAHCFGPRFDPGSGVLRAAPGAQRLRAGVADLEARRLRDPHVAFFNRRNPRHALGDELVCLARFDPGNLKEYIRRQL